jgi:hypothetical protein
LPRSKLAAGGLRRPGRNLEATTLNDIGSIYILVGDPRRAQDYAVEAREIKREVGGWQGE